jgi:hypothetical protein
MIHEHFVGTWLDSLLIAAREKGALLRAFLKTPEVVGTVYNDQLALRLAVGLCDPNGIFVNVGAPVGPVSTAVRRRHPRARVIAIEPAAEGARRTLDDLLPSEKISVLKIDAKGAELGVLLGTESVVSRARPLIAFESEPNVKDHSNRQANDRVNDDKARIWDWFAKRDYAVCAPNRVAHYDDGMALESFLDSHLYPRRTTNYIAIPRERRLEARAAARAFLGL